MEPQFWRTLCEALGCAELIEDQYGPPERQAQMAQRLQNVFDQRSRDEWMESLRDVEACVGPVNDVVEALRDPQVRHRHMVARVGDSEVGPGPAIKMTGSDPGPLRRAPRLGEHTAEVLRAVGLSEEDLTTLRSQGTT